MGSLDPDASVGGLVPTEWLAATDHELDKLR